MISNLDGSDARPVPGSADASSPTLWGDHVAWVEGNDKVITSLLDGAARKALGGVPKTVCNDYPGPGCGRADGATVDALGLYGQRLALVDSYAYSPNDDEFSFTEVRLERITGGPQQVLGELDVADADQTWVGPSWSDGKLFFYESSEGSGDHVDGYDPVHNTYLTAAGHALLAGFAAVDGGRRAYEVVTPETNSSQATAETDFGTPLCASSHPDRCELELSAPITFKPSHAPGSP